MHLLSNMPLEWTGHHLHPALGICPLPATQGQRWLHRKAVDGIVGLMVVTLDADNSQERTLQGLLLQSRAKRASPCSC
jgi:hypothetical protein